MTAAEELVLIDAALTQAYTANAQAYSNNGKGKTLLEIGKLIERKKELEATVARQTSGMWYAAQSRNPE